MNKGDLEVQGFPTGFVDLDKLFKGFPSNEMLVFMITSDVPIARQIINCHEDGSWSVDHFPNTQ